MKNWSDVPGCIVDNVPTLKCLEVVFGNLLYISSAIVVLILFVMFVMAAFNYLTAFGSADKVKKAQGILRYAIVGLVIFVSAFLIMKTIDIIFLGNEGRIFKLDFEQQQ